MAQPTRLEVSLKLDTVAELSREETYTAVSEWLVQASSTPSKILEDLNSYPQYASKS